MKKIASLLLTLVLAVSVTAPCIAAEEPQDALLEAAVNEGNDRTVEIELTVDGSVNNGVVTLFYPAEITLVSATSDIAADDGLNSLNTQTAGEATVSWATLRNGVPGEKETVLKVTLTGSVGKYKAYVSAETLANGVERFSADRVEVPLTLSGKPGTGGSSTPVIPSNPSEPGGPSDSDPNKGGTENAGIAEKFSDVDAKAWYAESVAYVVDKGLMLGVSEDEFNPEGELTRAMIVCVMYRAAGEPAVADAANFTDVASGSWYADAVAWAGTQGIVLGYGDGTYRPNDLLSRQDLVTILHRYAVKYMNAGESGGDLGGYADAGSVSDYAAGPMSWAVNSGVVNGFLSDGVATLQPGGAATRAQFSKMIYTLLEGVNQE